jgi:hypothetical protein
MLRFSARDALYVAPFRFNYIKGKPICQARKAMKKRATTGTHPSAGYSGLGFSNLAPARAFFPIHACILDLRFSCTSISGIILAGGRYLGMVATRPRPSSARDVAKNRHYRTKKAVASIIFFKK